MSICAYETNISAELPNVVFLIIEANPDFDNESQALACKRILSAYQIYTHQQTWVTYSVLRTFSLQLFTSIFSDTLGGCRDPSSSAWSPKETLAFCRTRMKKCESRWQDPWGPLWIWNISDGHDFGAPSAQKTKLVLHKHTHCLYYICLF